MHFFWNRQQQPQKQAELRCAVEIVCPRLSSTDFAGLKTAVEKAGNEIRRADERRKHQAGGVVLFSEDVLHHRYGWNKITKEEADKHACEIFNLLPKDIWLAVAYPVMLFEPKEQSNRYFSEGDPVPKNEGYLISPTDHSSKPKRMWSRFDESNCITYVRQAREGGGNEIPLEELFACNENNEGEWRMRGNRLQDGRVDFPRVLTPSGITLEHRICLDAVAAPIKKEKRAITIVSARRLSPDMIAKLLKKRLIIVANDSGRLGTDGRDFTGLASLGKYGKRTEGKVLVSRGSIFDTVSVFEEKPI